MVLRALTVNGPWAVVAPEDVDGACSVHSELEHMLCDPATAEVAYAFRSQFDLVVREGPSVFANHIFEFVDEPIFVFKRKRFRAIGFNVGRQLVVCHIVQLVGRKIPSELIESARAFHLMFQDHDQRRGPFRPN